MGLPTEALEEDLVMEREMYNTIDNFCYLGDTLKRNVRMDAVVAMRVCLAEVHGANILIVLTLKELPRR